MTNRRDFLALTAASSLIASVPAVAMSSKPQQLPTRTIPGSDLRLPIIGLGNSRAFSEGDAATTRSLLDIFLSHGGAYIDVGGSSRRFVGEVAAQMQRSEQLFFGNYVDTGDAGKLRSDLVSVAKAQGKGALDLLQTRDLGSYRTSNELLRRLQDEGLVRYIGIARSGADRFAEIGKLISDKMVDFVQFNYSLLEPQAAERLLPLAQDHGVAVNINRPFINGRYFDRVAGQTLPDWAAEFDCHSWAQFSLKFILAHPAVNCVLTETSNPKHAIDNIGAGFGALPDLKTQQKMLVLMQAMA